MLPLAVDTSLPRARKWQDAVLSPVLHIHMCTDTDNLTELALVARGINDLEHLMIRGSCIRYHHSFACSAEFQCCCLCSNNSQRGRQALPLAACIPLANSRLWHDAVLS